MTEATEPIGAPEVRYSGHRVDGSEYEAAVVCDQRVEGSVLFDLWNVDFDGEPAVLKEAASGHYRQEAIKRLRREASLMRRLAERPNQARRLSPFLGSGDRRTPSEPADSSAPHPHHFTRECTVLVNLIATGERNTTPLSKAARANLVVDAFAALAELHAADVIHRDLKPGNLVVEPVDGGGSRIEFIDFGHGLDLMQPPAADEPATGEDAVAGTEGWMCPHCYDERTRDPLCDVFAMALVGAAILLEQTRALLPGVRSNRESTGLIAPVGFPTRDEKDALRASLATMRDGLVERGPEGTARLILVVLVDALTPEPRGSDGEPARPTAQEIHDRLIEVRSPRATPTAADEAPEGREEAEAAPVDAPPPALVPVPDLVEDAPPPEASDGPYDDADHDTPPRMGEVVDVDEADPPLMGEVVEMDDEVPPLMGALVKGERAGEPDEPIDDVTPEPVSPWADAGGDADGGDPRDAVPADGDPRDPETTEPGGGASDPDDGSAGAEQAASSIPKAPLRVAASLPHPEDVAIAAKRLQGVATPSSRLPYRRRNLLTPKSGLGSLSGTKDLQLPWIAVVTLVVLVVVLVLVLVLQ